MFLVLALLACLGNSGDNKPVLWADPGRVEAIDFSVGAGGPNLAPKPPFQFVREATGGTNPKVIVRDARNVEWRVKGGWEVRAETFVTRLVAALGYYAEPTYFFARGKIEGLQKLSRAAGFVKADGSFSYASFERIDPAAKFLEKEEWTWNKSSFAGTRELNGLKILVMLVSDWDNKDGREGSGSNTSVLECRSGGSKQRVYFVNDWGQTMGGWGRTGRFKTHTPWNCAEYRQQTDDFVAGVEGHLVTFGYLGKHTEDFKEGITVEDVGWLMQYLGRITDAQIRLGLLSSGASKEEEDCFTSALRNRIEQLRKIAEPPK